MLPYILTLSTNILISLYPCPWTTIQSGPMNLEHCLRNVFTKLFNNIYFKYFDFKMYQMYLNSVFIKLFFKEHNIC